MARLAPIARGAAGVAPAPGPKKTRGAFFTPPALADFLTSWALKGNPEATVLDPTCGEAVFLLSASRLLAGLRQPCEVAPEQLFGLELDQQSVQEASRLLNLSGASATLICADFFESPTPDRPDPPLPYVDAVVGNPPFVRYQLHNGEMRRKAIEAALRQGVRVSGLASSWVATLVHASAFLKPGGRLGLVLPAELLTVGYAEPVRRWLKRRFASVELVLFGRLQFPDALADVVLLLAEGQGGCDSLSLHLVDDVRDLQAEHWPPGRVVTPADEGKWTELLLSPRQRDLFARVSAESFVPLEGYGTLELGTVTGANDFFAVSEWTRVQQELSAKHVVPICPPSSKHLKGLELTSQDWTDLRDAGERVWLFDPDPSDRSKSIGKYVDLGAARGVDQAYKCRIRNPWWKPPAGARPDIFFTYMSHRYPRLVANLAGVRYLNSMHGLTLRQDCPDFVARALALTACNSLTMLGAELRGRSYGGGVLKMEPREAAVLPVPALEPLHQAWQTLSAEVADLDASLRSGRWRDVVARVDAVLLQDIGGLCADDIAEIRAAARALRERRLRRNGDR